ncbi:MAG: Asp-tRNA(Asn)/Glu-tRNA(Gln) amidotransferase subunit GatA [Bacilli bacterium]|nr:Asp-tRNA(Asn)/Glu-tRNA(Gln) amidotransferase subunit GatA [Bacilli bacterium]
MNKYLDLPLIEINTLLKNKTIKPLDLVMEAIDRIEKNKELNAFITVNKEKAIEEAKALENKEVDNLLFGLPIAIKDNISTQDIKTTCASKMLENYTPIFDATVVQKIKEKNMIIIGKANMDEFAMGSTSRTSYFGAPKNPWDTSRIAGGSSGGSASLVAARLTPFALGSDTGGSIRQPASYTGIVGMKPTYGSISRYGLVAFASSLDQIGPMTRNVYENAVLLNTLIGQDEKDLTNISRDKEDFTRYIGQDIKGMKIGIPNYFMGDVVNPEIKQKVEKIVSLLEEKGAVTEYIDIEHIENAVTLYQIIAMGEASSNLARFDGIRYGYAKENAASVEELYTKTRAEGFGKEVKRRIMVGSYLLSGSNATEYYNKALSLRSSIQKSFEKAFEKYDLIIGPTTTTTAYGLTEEMDNPLKSFLDDILVIPVNMAGLPGMSVPIGFDSKHLPIGLHIIGNRLEEAKMYQLASLIEKECNLALHPLEGGNHANI